MLQDSDSDSSIQIRFSTKRAKDRDERPVLCCFPLMKCGSKQKSARESKDEASRRSPTLFSTGGI